MRPLDPAGSAGTEMAVLGEALFTALAGLAALETVADFAVLRVEGKLRFYQVEQSRRLGRGRFSVFALGQGQPRTLKRHTWCVSSNPGAPLKLTLLEWVG